MDEEAVRKDVLIAFEYSCQHDHNAYHIGQITKMRELQAAQGTAG